MNHIMNPEIYPTQTMMERAREFVESHPLATYGSAFVIACGGAAVKTAAEAPNAFADEAPTGQTGPTGPETPTPSTGPAPQNPGNTASNNPNLCPEFPTQPCDMGRDPATFDNQDILGCQTAAIGDSKNNGMILSRDIRYKLGSKQVRVAEKISALELWSVYAFDSACAGSTNNKVNQRIVSARPSKKSPKTSVYKRATRSNTMQGSNKVEFDPTHFGNGGDLTIVRTYKLPRKLTKNDVKKHRYCLEDTIISEPKFQRPHLDPYNRPEFSVPGPMTTKTRKIYTCVKKQQVSNSKTKKK